MLQTVVSNVIRMVFLILLQSLVVSRMELMNGMVLPWIYIFGILMLPFESPRWLTLLVAFVVGFIMDYFNGPMGLHTSACVVLGYMQPVVQKVFSPREGYEVTQRPTVQSMGLPWYTTYAGILTFIHHGWLFFMEMFRFSGFFYTILHVLLSAAATLGLMIIGQYLIFTSKSKQL